ncbi:MAG: prolyl oligopeptidase family serine peptidase [candidate division Zixibacteria bacterium]|nr:prolyl oligopeptidase family serine peptidase [candidate division Zixibacteria bacterium]
MRFTSILLVLLLILTASPDLFSQGHIGPPSTRVGMIVDTIHGVAIEDPYRWLEDSQTDEVIAWTEKQNQYFRSYVDSYPGRAKLAGRISELMTVGSVSSPSVRGDNYFYYRRDGDQNHSILYRKHGLNGEPEVIIDPNTFSEDGTVALDWLYLSPDGSLTAYGKSNSGSERSTLFLMRTDDQSLLIDTIPFTRGVSLAWLPDNSGFYYTRFATIGEVPEEDNDYYRRVFLHTIGQRWENDPLIYENKDDKTAWPGVSLSPDGTKLVISVFQGWSRSDLYFKDLSDPESKLVKINGSHEGNLSAHPLDDCFFVRSNYEAPRYRLLKGTYDQPGAEHWQVIIPERESIAQSFMVVDSLIVLRSLSKAHTVIEIFDTNGGPVKTLQLPTIGTASRLSGEHDGHELFFRFSSFNNPSTVLRYDFDRDTIDTFDQVPAGIDVSSIEVTQVWYKSVDGTPVSMFVVHRDDVALNGQNPTYLSGYGGFNVNETPYFSRLIAFWVNRGGVYALPNLRGGGEYGEEWHQAGMLENKQNSFDDFIAAAEYLIAEGYTSPEHLLLSGGSNGGLLVGAVVNQRPDLCKAVVCSVPLLDMIRYHQFLIARLWIPEYGSSEDSTQFEFIYAYSPYHNVKKSADYPAILFKASESDGRVHPMHARKMTALLQAQTGPDNPILLRLETKAGHGQGKPTSKRIEDKVDTWCFIFRTLGLDM